MVARPLLVTVAASLLLLPLTGAYAIYFLAPGVGTFHDDGIYLVLARALAEEQGYRIVSLPEEPFQNKYPILFPWLLSLVWELLPSFPVNVSALRLVPLAAALTWFATSWFLCRRLGTPPLAAGAMVLLTAVSPWVVFLSTMLLAETLFAALITAAVVFLTRIHVGDARKYDAFIAGLLMGGSFITRAAGVAPLAAGLASLALQRRWRSCLEYGAGAMTLAIPWLWWGASQMAAEAVDPFYSRSNYETWNIVLNFGWREKLNVIFVNAIYLSALGDLWGIDSSRVAGHLVGIVCAALVSRGLWKMRTTPIALVVLFTVAMLFTYVWPPARFLVPLLPLLAWLAYEGAGRAARPVLVGLAMVLLLSASIELWQLQPIVRQRGSTTYAATGWVFDWYAMKRQIDWVDRQTPKEAVLATIHDPTYYLFTGRKAIRPFEYNAIERYYGGVRRTELEEAEDFGRTVFSRNVLYVIVTPQDGLASATQHLLKLAPGSLLPVMGDPESGYVIYRVDHGRLAAWMKQPSADGTGSG